MRKKRKTHEDDAELPVVAANVVRCSSSLFSALLSFLCRLPFFISPPHSLTIAVMPRISPFSLSLSLFPLQPVPHASMMPRAVQHHPREFFFSFSCRSLILFLFIISSSYPPLSLPLPLSHSPSPSPFSPIILPIEQHILARLSSKW